MFEKYIGREAYCDFQNKKVTVKTLTVRTALYTKKGKLMFAPAVSAASEEEAKAKTLELASQYVNVKRLRRFWGEVKVLDVIYVDCPICASHHLSLR